MDTNDDPAFATTWSVPRSAASGKRLAALALIVLVGLQGIVAVSFQKQTPPVAFDTEAISVAEVQLQRALNAFEADTRAAQAPTGSDVALARWCLKIDAPTCAWDGHYTTREAATQVMHALDNRTILPSRDPVNEAALALARAYATPLPQPFLTLGQLRLLLFDAIASLLLTLVAFSTLLLPRSPVQVRLSQHKIQVGAIELHPIDLTDCRVDGQRLIVYRSGRQSHLTPALAAPVDALEDIAAAIRERVPTRDARIEATRSRVALARHHAQLTQRLSRD